MAKKPTVEVSAVEDLGDIIAPLPEEKKKSRAETIKEAAKKVSAPWAIPSNAAYGLYKIVTKTDPLEDAVKYLQRIQEVTPAKGDIKFSDGGKVRGWGKARGARTAKTY
jgi:hypothetical protein